MHGIVLAAGRGTRMAPIGVPKPLLPIGNTTLLQRVIDQLRPHVDGITVVVHHQAEAVRAAVDVRCVDQGEPRGTGHAVAAAGVTDDAIVVMGDAVFDDATIAAIAKAKGLAVAGKQVDDCSSYGALQVDGRVTGIAEKSVSGPGWANTGLYRIPADILAKASRLKPSARGELELTDLIVDAALVEATQWLDVGTPWDYLTAHEAILGNHLTPGGTFEDGVYIRGRVENHGLVKSGTYIEGDVYIGPGSVVGPNAYIRGPAAIHGGKVGAGSEIKNSILLAGANAPHRNYVGDSVLGPGCNLGAGATIANVKHSGRTVRVGTVDTGRRKFGAVIGDGAKLGILCALNPGTVIGAGEKVGAGEVR